MRAPLLARLGNRLRRRELPTWHSPAYRLPITGLEGTLGFEPRRADYVVWWLLESGTLARSWLRAPQRISYEDLDRVHTLELLESLGRPEALARIFAADPSDVPADALMDAVRLACGGTLAAAREALRRGGPTLNLLGGFHHAFPGTAGGFCPVNDIAVAIAALRADGFEGRVAVLDLDAHPPDGLAACLAGDRAAWIGSLSGISWGDVPGADETVLPEGTGDRGYLQALASLLGRMPRPALAFVIAGGDVLLGDRFGRLGLSLEGARSRDLDVAANLAGVPSVWLPGGGYHPQAWRLLGGTAMALACGSRAGISGRYDPLSRRFRHISAGLLDAELSEADFTSADLEEALGLSGQRSRQRLLLGYYTAAGLEYGLYRYGVLDHLRRIGYGGFRVALDRAPPGERLRLFGRSAGAEHLLVEAILERRRMAGADVLYVHWLSLRNPRAQFSPLRPRLPGQEVPGLGIAREIGEMLGLMARRLGAAAVVFRPAHYHTAFPARHNFAFLDAARQGRFEALVRDLAGVPLREATVAIAEGRVLLDGKPYAWEADEMAIWLRPSPHTARSPEVVRERERRRFTIAPRC